MKAGQKVAIWLHDSAAKLFLGLRGRRPVSRWAVQGIVDALDETPIGVWVNIDHNIEERRPQRGRKVQRVSWVVKPPRCLIRWEYIISVQLLAEADKPEDIDFRPGTYL